LAEKWEDSTVVLMAEWKVGLKDVYRAEEKVLELAETRAESKGRLMAMTSAGSSAD